MDVSLSIISIEAPSLRYACETVLNDREAIYRDKLVVSGFPISRGKHLSALISLLNETLGNVALTAFMNEFGVPATTVQ
jgi:hypothetical protein